jgi:hypothetical protein
MESGGSPRGLNQITHHTSNPMQLTDVAINDTKYNADGGIHWTMRALHPIIARNSSLRNPWADQPINEIKTTLNLNTLCAALLIKRKEINISSTLHGRADQWKEKYNTVADVHGTPEKYIEKNSLKIINESSTNNSSRLDDVLFDPLHQSIISSQFWLHDNSSDNSDYNIVLDNNVDQTEAAEQLTSELNNFFKTNKIPVTVAVNTPDPYDNPKTIIGPSHPNYPNKIVIGGNQGLAGDVGQRNSSKFFMNLHLGTYGDNFSISDINPTVLSQNIGRLIRHELIHLYQIEARRKNQKISRLSALQNYRKEGEVPSSDRREDYLSSKIEIDAYAHEFAEELLQQYGSAVSFDIARGDYPKDFLLTASDQIKEYLVAHKSSAFTRRLRQKMFGHLMSLSKKEIYKK